MEQNKNSKVIAGIIIAVVVIVGIVMLQKKDIGPAPLIPGTTEPVYKIPEAGAPETQAVKPLPNQTESATAEPGEKVFVVVYSDAGFTPNTLDITKGTVVSFKNLSSAGMWVASAQHPTHDEYPEKGGCINSKFDACQEIKQNQEWRFRFNELGTWKYHNHYHPGHVGTIQVTRF
jgi:plastocyanin